MAAAVIVEHAGQAVLEALLVGAAVRSVDVVGKAQQTLVVAGIILQGDFCHAPVGLTLEAVSYTHLVLGGVVVADALAAAGGDAVGVDVRAPALAVFGDGEHRAARLLPVLRQPVWKISLSPLSKIKKT